MSEAIPNQELSRFDTEANLRRIIDNLSNISQRQNTMNTALIIRLASIDSLNVSLRRKLHASKKRNRKLKQKVEHYKNELSNAGYASSDLEPESEVQSTTQNSH